MRKKIAYVRISATPIPNTLMSGVLAQAFPEFDVETFQLSTILKGMPDQMIRNGLHMLLSDTPSLISRRHGMWETFYSTAYFINWVKQFMAKHVSPEEYAFTFQIQSKFDASVPGLPHYVYTDHTHLANLAYKDYDRKKLHSPAWIAREKSIYHNATMNFTRSSNITRSLVEQYGCDASRIACIGVGSNIPIRDLQPENDGYRNKNILFVGVEWERKGGPELVEAFRQVLTIHPDAHLTIVGCSPEVDVPNCTIVGSVPSKDLPPYYQKASIFCLPTRREPFGVVFIEAMHYRLPIVATNIGAIPDLVREGENGYLFETGDVPALTNALIRLLDHPEACAAFGERSYQHARETYTWEQVASKVRFHVAPALGIST